MTVLLTRRKKRLRVLRGEAAIVLPMSGGERRVTLRRRRLRVVLE